MKDDIHIIEHEPEIVTKYGTYKKSVWEQLKPIYAEQERKLAEERNAALRSAAPVKACPFRRGVSDACNKNCAWYADGCTMGASCTNGKPCPLNNGMECGEGCTFNHKGACALYNR